MAASIQNTLTPGGAVVPTLVTKLPRGKPTQLGTITTANDAVSFTFSEPSGMNQGFLVIQTRGGTTPVCVLEFSLDGGTSWEGFTATPAAAITGIYFPYSTAAGALLSDTAATFAAQYNVGGLGSGALFRFGLT